MTIHDEGEAEGLGSEAADEGVLRAAPTPYETGSPLVRLGESPSDV